MTSTSPRQRSRPAAGGAAWTASDIPGQSGRTVVVTGANTGIGFETARMLVARGATVVLACRDLTRAREARDRLAAGDRVEVVRLDLGSLSSVRAAAAELRAAHDRIDLLINNAGVANLAGRTEDGFEPHFGVNHLGHFALTGLLLDRLLAAPGSRVVAVSSFAYRFARPDLDGTSGERNWYGWSKLANVMFMSELQRRLTATGASSIAVAAHPGLARTEVLRYSTRLFRNTTLMVTALAGHAPDHAALPTLRAATDPRVEGGELYAPSWPGGTRGRPVRVRLGGPAHDEDLCERLWEESARQTGVVYDL